MDFNSIKAKYLNVKFLSNNILYIIFFFIYFNLTWQVLRLFFVKDVVISFLITATAYFASISTALSIIGDYILRFINGARKLETKREKEYLIPLFTDVYEEAKIKYPNLEKDIEICIVDAMYINAFATGRRTVAVTKGAVESLSEEELKGFIAHELGHIANGDTKAILLTTIGNGIFSIFIILLQKIINILDTLFHGIGILWILITIVKLIFYIILFYFGYYVQIVLALNSRKNEYEADKFAYEVGYGNNLVEALYLLQGMSISSEKSTLVNKLRASHPHIATRIGRLETMIDNAIAEIDKKDKE